MNAPSARLGRAARWAAALALAAPAFAPAQPSSPAAAPAAAASSAQAPATARGPVTHWTFAAGDFAVLQAEGGPQLLSLDLSGPDGTLLRRVAPTSPGQTELAFVAPATGRYRVVARSDSAVPASLPWRLAQHVPAAQQAPAEAPPAAPARLDSPRLRALQQTLADAPSESAAATDAFWREVAAQGAPLAEPLDGTPGTVALTFLWRGTPATRSVEVSWAMRTEQPFRLARLGTSDVWFLTVRVPAGLRAAYQLVPDAPRWPVGVVPTRMQRHIAGTAVAQADPLNARRWPAQPPGGGSAVADVHAQQSVVSLAGALAEPWLDMPVPATARGTLQPLPIASARLGNARTVQLYLPAQAPTAPGTLPLLVMLDGEAYRDRVQLPGVLDALIASGRLPPVAAVFVGNPARAARATEFTANADFTAFLADELLPAVRARWPQLATDPARVAVAGSSYGGLAAAAAAFTRPQVFGNVIALSGSFWWAPRNVPGPDFDRWGEGEWLTREIAAAPRQPVRWFVTAGLMEITLTGDGGGILDSSRHLRTVLQTQGADLTYREFAGGHDGYAWRGELAQGLMALWGTPP